MSSFTKMLIQDKEINDIRNEWLKINMKTWKPFNFDEYNSIDDYKQKLRIELEKMKKEKNISD